LLTGSCSVRRAALGEPVVVDGPVPCNRVGRRLMFQLPMSARAHCQRRRSRPVGRARRGQLGLLEPSPGDVVDWRVGTGHHVYEVTGVSRDHEALLEINRSLHEEVSVVYECE